MKKFHCAVCHEETYFPEYRRKEKVVDGVKVSKDYPYCPACMNDFREKDLFQNVEFLIFVNQLYNLMEYFKQNLALVSTEPELHRVQPLC